MKPPRETVPVVLPRPLIYTIRSRYEPEITDDLLRMLGCAQMEQSFRRMAGWPAIGLGLLVAGSLLGVVHPLIGLVLCTLCCVAIGRFGYCKLQYATRRMNIWNADPERWKAIADELEPVEQECLRRGDPTEKLTLRL